MRLLVPALVVLAALSGCTAIKDATLTAGATLGPDPRVVNATMPLVGGFVGARSNVFGAEAGLEAGLRTNLMEHVMPGPSNELEMAVQPYVNVTYTPLRMGHARLYVLGGAHLYHVSSRMTDAEEYGLSGEFAGHTDGALSAGVGAGFRSVSVEAYRAFSLGHALWDDDPGVAVRARVTLPIRRFGGR